jgi:hypothetical protein
MFLIRGIVFSYKAVRDREAKLTPAPAELQPIDLEFGLPPFV